MQCFDVLTILFMYLMTRSSPVDLLVNYNIIHYITRTCSPKQGKRGQDLHNACRF